MIHKKNIEIFYIIYFLLYSNYIKISLNVIINVYYVYYNNVYIIDTIDNIK